jgi:hypothetical protein
MEISDSAGRTVFVQVQTQNKRRRGMDSLLHVGMYNTSVTNKYRYDLSFNDQLQY